MTFGLIASKLPTKALSIVLLMVAMSMYITPANVSAGITKRVYLTSGTSWTVPADWSSSNNTIEAIGGGGSGDEGNMTGYGGGGGAYAAISNLSLTPSSSVNYRIGNTAGTIDTIFNTTATVCEGSPTASVCAESGGMASGADAAGGTTGNSIGTTKYAGGYGGGGGGGAGGPSAAGTDGSSGYGGYGNGGSGGEGGTPGEDFGGFCSFSVVDGGSGEEYSTIPRYGTGGGGAGALRIGFLEDRDDCPPGSAGQYGGGGGGGTTWLGYSGSGYAGLLVITYESTDSGSTSTAKFKITGGKVQILGGRVLIR